MATLLVTHEVNDVEHWRSSTKRDEFFGSMGITVRTFRDPGNPNRVGLILEGVDDLGALEQALQGEDAAEAMKHDGVRPETLVLLVEA